MPRIVGLLFIYTLLYTCSRCAGFSVSCKKPEWFKCDNNNCIAFTFECDGEDDCDDNSDEKNCENFTLAYPSSFNCIKYEFQCKNSKCIPAEKFCDTINDCTDGSDEYDGCVKDLKCDGKFRCSNGYCIQKSWVCDGRKDCSDNSDERNCDNRTLSASDCNNENNRYLCKNQRCISLNVVCNKNDDCGDGSDEGASCENSTALCASAGCNHICRITPQKPVCVCHPGYVLQNDHKCIDINECEIYGKCDQRCVNYEGSYKCLCQEGYTLQDDKRTCKADGGEATMVFSTTTEIRQIFLTSKIYFRVEGNLSHVVGVATDRDYTYWSEVNQGNRAIIRSTLGGKHEFIVTTGIHTLSDIVVDWITGNIYFTDDGYMRIGVCDNNGTYCTILINAHANQPRGLALLPTNGIMYWCNWGDNANIAMAGMDGKNSSLFVTKNIKWPNSVTIDYPNNRLYWIDAKLAIIESIRLDGTDRRIVLDKVTKHPFSLAVFENNLYWSDWDKTIQTCDKFSGKDWKILIRTSNTPYGVHIDHPAIKPKVYNPCYKNPCSQLCLLNQNNSYTCDCTLDKELKSDKHTCRDARKKLHVIIAAKDAFINYYHELLGKPKITTNVAARSITAITYDSLSGTVLASEFTSKILRYNPINDTVTTLMSMENKVVGGMAFDHIGNNLYVSDIEQEIIEVHSLTTMKKTLFYFKESPHAIALVPEENVMFVVFHGKNSYHIDKMQMTGLGARTQFVKSDSLSGPKVSLCYDRDSKRIFWSDQNTGHIESAEITGLNKYVFRSGLKEPVSLAITDEHVFWTIRDSNLLFWADKNDIYQNNQEIAIRMSKRVKIPHLVALNGVIVHEENSCHKDNGNCSHVCLPSSTTSYICACPPEMMLSANNRTCSLQSACPTGEIKCSEHDVCVKRHQWCNGVKDCPNGEDEQYGCEETGTCGQDQFMCKNGICISSKLRCNSVSDCIDHSDEIDCIPKRCGKDEFQCHEGMCISNFLLCNGQADCSDFSDELNCREHKCSADSFTCNTQTCIPKNWVCDGQSDCPDGSDETEKCQASFCSEEMFKCSNVRCIPSTLRCDGFNDCGDESDEQNCLMNIGHSGNCTDDEYSCYNTDICLPKKVRCNGVQDCPKNDDEHNCAYCYENEFTCDNQRCIPQEWVCDKTDDCGDKSDEKDCGSSKWKNTNVNTTAGCEEFMCSNGACLSFKKVCDGVQHCPDASDEKGKCNTSCTQNNRCLGLCHKTPLGGVCGCQEGYNLAADQVSCNDINECEHEVCSQICHNIVGSYRCSCFDGYVIRNDKISCKTLGPPMELIVITDNTIRKIPSNLYSIEVIHSLSGLAVSGFDVNAKNDAIYWSNDNLGTISKLNLKTKETTIMSGIGRPEVLAVDWITNNIYLSNNDRPNTIKICNMEQQKCTTMIKIKEAVTRVTSLVVDPGNRWLFWSQITWKMHNNPFSEICRTNMMGADMKAIVFRNVGVVSGMTIDHMKSKLYWSDSFYKTVESSNLDGTQRTVFLTIDKYQPFSVNIYENSLYWLMGLSGQLRKCKLYGEKSCEVIDVGNIHKHFAFLHISKHPFAKNSCEKLNCSHMCVLKDDGTPCICEDGKPINPNGTCTESKNSIITVSKSADVKSSTVTRYNTFSGLLVTILFIILFLTGYFYYQKNKLKMRRSNKFSFSSIRFHNPSYDRRDEVAALASAALTVSPGEHEYINPINDKLLKIAKENTAKRSETISATQSEKEVDTTEKQDVLISFTR